MRESVRKKNIKNNTKNYHSIENKSKSINITFGDPLLSTDNAVGIALLGMKTYKELNTEEKD